MIINQKMKWKVRKNQNSRKKTYLNKAQKVLILIRDWMNQAVKKANRNLINPTKRNSLKFQISQALMMTIIKRQEELQR